MKEWTAESIAQGFEPGISHLEIQHSNLWKQVSFSVIYSVIRVFQITLRGWEIPQVGEGMRNFAKVDVYLFIGWWEFDKE